jgi:hypothetical protein
MGKIYVNQTQLRIQLNVGVSVVGALALKIKYTKPTGVSGEFVASEDTSTTKTIYYDFSQPDLNVAGDWLFWAYVTFANGKSAPGEPVRIKIWAEGT